MLSNLPTCYKGYRVCLLFEKNFVEGRCVRVRVRVAKAKLHV